MFSRACAASMAISCMTLFLCRSLSGYCSDASYAKEMMVSLMKIRSSANALMQLATRAIDPRSVGVISS